MIFAKNVVLAT